MDYLAGIDWMRALMLAIPAFFAITLNAAIRGVVAWLCGDHSARVAGRVTLNLFKHVDLFGTVLLPLIMILGKMPIIFGYAKEVPINYASFRHPRVGLFLVAASGPVTNLLLAVASGILYLAFVSRGVRSTFLEQMLILSVQINFVFAIFNLLPLPPLDGSKIVAAFLPGRMPERVLGLDVVGSFFILALLVVSVFGPNFGYDVNIIQKAVIEPSAYLTTALIHGLQALLFR